MNVDSFARYAVRMDGVEMGIFYSQEMADLFGLALRSRYPAGDVRVCPRVR